MTDSLSSEAQLAGTLMEFTPVPQERRRHDGWSADRQRRFILALRAMGSVGPAARAVGMGRASAYRLRDRAGAGGFATAWDRAIEFGRDRMYDVAMDQALNGVTTLRVLRGGSVSVSCGPDMRLVHNALRDEPPLRSTKETV